MRPSPARTRRCAESLLDERPHEPDAHGYNTLLHGYAQLWASDWSEEERVARAAALLRRMEAQGVEPNLMTYNCLLDLHRFDPRRVRELLRQANARDGE